MKTGKKRSRCFEGSPIDPFFSTSNPSTTGVVCKKNEFCICLSCKEFFADREMHTIAMKQFWDDTDSIAVLYDQMPEEHFFFTIREATKEHPDTKAKIQEKMQFITTLLTLTTDDKLKVRLALEKEAQDLSFNDLRQLTLQCSLDSEKQKILTAFLQLDTPLEWLSEVSESLELPTKREKQGTQTNSWPELKFLSMSLKDIQANEKFLEEEAPKESLCQPKVERKLDEKLRRRWAINHIIDSNNAIYDYRSTMSSCCEKLKDEKERQKISQSWFSGTLQIVARINQLVLRAPRITSAFTVFRSQTTARPFCRTLPRHLSEIIQEESLAGHCVKIGTQIQTCSFLQCSAKQTLGVFGRDGLYPYWSEKQHGYIFIIHVPEGTRVLCVENSHHVLLPPYITLKIKARFTRPVYAQSVGRTVALTCYELDLINSSSS